MKFSIYLLRLSELLGEHQLPVNPHWQRASDIVRPEAVQYPLIKRIITGLYKKGGCSKPADSIAIRTILDHLGQLLHELRQEPGHDLLAIELVEQIGEISVALYNEATYLQNNSSDGNNPVYGTESSLLTTGSQSLRPTSS